jgi:hypothetical protein
MRKASYPWQWKRPTACTLMVLAICVEGLEGFMHVACPFKCAGGTASLLKTTRPHVGLALAARRRKALRLSDSEPASGPDPQDWRVFRAALIERGIQMTAGAQVEGGVSSNTTRWGGTGTLRKSVATANEELLMAQNPELAQEYLAGVWAHETGQPEAGGLLVRMPLEFEMTTLMRQAQRHAVGYGRGGMSGAELALGHKLCSRLIDGAWNENSADDRIGELSRNMSYVYEMADRVVEQELGDTVSPVGDMRIKTDGLSDQASALLSMYVSSIDNWQVISVLTRVQSAYVHIHAIVHMYLCAYAFICTYYTYVCMCMYTYRMFS